MRGYLFRYTNIVALFAITMAWTTARGLYDDSQIAGQLVVRTFAFLATPVNWLGPAQPALNRRIQLMATARRDCLCLDNIWTHTKCGLKDDVNNND